MQCENCGKDRPYDAKRFCCNMCARSYRTNQQIEIRKQVINLLLEGCENREIGSKLNIAQRTVKAYLNRMYVVHNITDGIKRVKLAVLYYRKQLQEEQGVK